MNVLAEVSELQWDIICFSETRAVSNDVTLMGGHRLITQLGKNKYGGVAVLIHERYADSIATIREKEKAGR